MDVGGWLRTLGLGQHEAAFRDNAIRADVIADLTDGDLEKLGLPLGARKRLLKAIAGLMGTPAATTRSDSVISFQIRKKTCKGRWHARQISWTMNPSRTLERASLRQIRIYSGLAGL